MVYVFSVYVINVFANKGQLVIDHHRILTPLLGRGLHQ